MCAEGEGNDESQQEKDEEEESLSPHVFGAQIIDTMALVLPVKHVVGPALSFVAQYGRPEMHFRQRRAAVTAITVLTEGCAEAIKDTLGMVYLTKNMPAGGNQLLAGTVVQFVVSALADPSYLVRQAACLAVGQCADNLQPEIIAHHEVIIPALLQGKRQPTKKEEEARKKEWFDNLLIIMQRFKRSKGSCCPSLLLRFGSVL